MLRDLFRLLAMNHPSIFKPSFASDTLYQIFEEVSDFLQSCVDILLIILLKYPFQKLPHPLRLLPQLRPLPLLWEPLPLGTFSA